MARLDLWIHGVDAPLLVRQVRIREQLSTPFEIAIVLRSPAPDIELDETSWAPASFSLVAGWAFVRGGGGRTWTGLVRRFELIAVEPAGLSTYRVFLVPRLHLLTENKDYRIFQKQTVPAIVTRLLDDWLVDHEWRLDPAAFPALEYRVQYGESDFAFLSRLCEEAGISFYFEARERGSVLVLTDDPGAAPPRPGPPLPFEAAPNEAAEAEYVTRVQLRRDGAPMRVVVRDVDFRRPGFPLYGEADAEATPSARLLRYHYMPGAFRVHTMRPPPSGAPAPDTVGAGRHDPRAGKDLAARLVLAETAQARSAAFETNALDLAPGMVCAIAAHPHPLLDPTSQKLLVTEFALDAEHDQQWLAQCHAVWTEPPYKPPLRTARPVVHGLQSGVVQGPPDREVFTDPHGRIKVRFFWDREAEDNEQTSCWIRVAQVWTGPGFGIWTVPRVGQEVLVGFLEGNPDEPVVVGHVPNALTPPPYPLPRHETRTVLRTRSTPESDGYNEISFEDRKGEELIYERAERDRETHVRREERALVEGSRKRRVGGDEHVSVGGDRREHIEGDEHRIIGGAVRGEVGGRASYVIDGDVDVVINGRLNVQVAGDVNLRAGGNAVTEAQDATVRGAGGFVRATAGAVLVTPLIENAGAPGVGAGSSPDAPSPPILPAAFRAPIPKAIVRLPVLGGGPLQGTLSKHEVTCEAICTCNKLADEQAAAGERRKAQICVTQKLRAYDKALGGKSGILAEVPYDMSQDPPVPIMSRNEPERPTRGSPKGSKIPDVIWKKDPDQPPTQDNLEKVIEVKFGKDKLSKENEKAYQRIAGSLDVEVWTPDKPCYCRDRQKEPAPAPAPVPAAGPKFDAETVALLAALALLLADDLVPGGVADDPAIIPILGRLALKLGF